MPAVKLLQENSKSSFENFCRICPVVPPAGIAVVRGENGGNTHLLVGDLDDPTAVTYRATRGGEGVAGQHRTGVHAACTLVRGQVGQVAAFHLTHHPGGRAGRGRWSR